MNFVFNFMGLVHIDDAVKLMNEKVTENVQQKTIWFMTMEHPLVYTAGLMTRDFHILDNKIDIKQVRRGGSVTVHNPGQLMIYPVTRLENIPGGLEAHIRKLEYAMIRALWDFKIDAFQFPPNSGVFTKFGKIAFVGVGLKNGSIFHGAALNIYNNLNDYSAIISCGLNYNVTNIREILSNRNIKVPEIQYVAEKVFYHFQQSFEKPTRADFIEDIQFIEKIGNSDVLMKLALLFFNTRMFWQAHETWEYLWHKSKDNEYKLFLQGLIQTASGLFRMRHRPTRKGVISLFSKAHEKLKNSKYLNQLLFFGNSANLPQWIADMILSLNSTGANPEVNEDQIWKKGFSPCLLAWRDDYESVS